MANIKKELDKIKECISDASFLANKGLSNEVRIYVYKYAPQYELMVRDFIKRVVGTPYGNHMVIELDMYKIFLDILEEKSVLYKVSLMEENKGKDYLLANLQKIATPREFFDKMKYEPGDVLFLTGVGKVYPFMRSHKILDVMQPVLTNTPIVLFYPGEFDGQSLTLFEKFRDANYYRLFNLL